MVDNNDTENLVNPEYLLRIPQKMQNQLSEATTFEEASHVFKKWEAIGCYVNPSYQRQTWKATQ